jgi:hypothetical protein
LEAACDRKGEREGKGDEESVASCFDWVQEEDIAYADKHRQDVAGKERESERESAIEYTQGAVVAGPESVIVKERATAATVATDDRSRRWCFDFEFKFCDFLPTDYATDDPSPAAAKQGATTSPPVQVFGCWVHLRQHVPRRSEHEASSLETGNFTLVVLRQAKRDLGLGTLPRNRHSRLQPTLPVQSHDGTDFFGCVGCERSSFF